MRRAIMFLLLASSVYAAVPSAFSVQGVLRDNTGQLQSMAVMVTVSLFDAQMGGNKLAGPFTQSVMAESGLFTMPISDASLQAELAPASQVWLEVAVGSDTFTRQLVNPQLFALQCGTADVAKGLPNVTVSGGKVGIGTTTPTVPLEVNGTASASLFGTGQIPGLSAGKGTIVDAPGNAYGRVQAWSFIGPSPMPLAINDAGGNVGLGTTAPGAKLHVAGTGFNAGGILAESKDSGNGVIIKGVDGAGINDVVFLGLDDGNAAHGAFIGITGTATGVVGDLRIATGGNSEAMRITKAGRVGIGTIAPAAALDVQTATPGLKVGGTCVSGTCPSDRRLKTDIHYLSGALDKLRRLKPAAYRYKNQPHAGFGLIAQDVQAVAPELVRTSPDGMLAVDYSPLEMMLIQAAGELSQENAALKKQLARIEARLDQATR